MSTQDLIKAAILFVFFTCAVPLITFVLYRRPHLQRIAMIALCLSTMEGLMGAQNWGLTLGNVYIAPRSHTKGFYFFFNVALAMGMTFASFWEDRKSFRWFPPGLLLYVFYCALSAISIPTAVLPHLAMMALHKHLILIWLFMAAFNCLKTEEDFLNLATGMSLVMMWQAFLCLLQKYVYGIHQAFGTFEHQNSLGMYAVLIGLTLLAVSLGPRKGGPNIPLYGYLASALVCVLTVSRGTMASMAAGTAVVIAISFLRRVNVRVLAIAGFLALCAAVGLAMTLDTIVDRFETGDDAGSAEQRLVMIESSKMMLADRPQGIGWNNYAYVANPPFRYAGPYIEFFESKGHRIEPDELFGVVESHYYLLLSETGYQGLFGWLLLVVVCLWRNIIAFFRFGYSVPGMFSLGIAVSSLFNYAQSTLERTLTQPRNLMMFLILIGLTARIHIMRKEGYRPENW